MVLRIEIVVKLLPEKELLALSGLLLTLAFGLGWL